MFGNSFCSFCRKFERWNDSSISTLLYEIWKCVWIPTQCKSATCQLSYTSEQWGKTLGSLCFMYNGWVRMCTSQGVTTHHLEIQMWKNQCFKKNCEWKVPRILVRVVTTIPMFHARILMRLVAILAFLLCPVPAGLCMAKLRSLKRGLIFSWESQGFWCRVKRATCSES